MNPLASPSSSTCIDSLHPKRGRSQIKPSFLLLLILAVVMLVISSCTSPTQPEFLRTEKVRVVKANLKEVVVTADMVFHNPNSIGLTVSGMDIKLLANEIEAANLVQELELRVEPNSDFTLPVIADFPAGKIFHKSNFGGILSGVLDALAGKEVELHYFGTVTVKLKGIPINIPVFHKEKKKMMQDR